MPSEDLFDSSVVPGSEVEKAGDVANARFLHQTWKIGPLSLRWKKEEISKPRSALSL